MGFLLGGSHWTINNLSALKDKLSDENKILLIALLAGSFLTPSAKGHHKGGLLKIQHTTLHSMRNPPFFKPNNSNHISTHSSSSSSSSSYSSQAKPSIT
ncbi:unnamed protein product [Camellia sinensis]